MKKKAMILFSGGLDSTTCLALAIQQYGKDQVAALSITYGQKHQKELDAARRILDYYEISGTTLDLERIFADSNCSLLKHSSEPIPEQSYQEQLAGSNQPVSTYVPFRNGLFLASAASMALSYGCEEVWYGAHRDDAAGSAYPDCSPAFFDSMKAAVWEGSGRQLTLKAPFLTWSKADVVAKGLALQVPYAYTWSCYEGHEKACGRCGTCRDRLAAFAANGVKDPISYESDSREGK